MNKIYLLIFVLLINSSLYSQGELTPKDILKLSLYKYISTNHGTVDVNTSYKYSQYVDTLKYSYKFTYIGKSIFFVPEFNIRYSNIDINIFCLKNFMYILNNDSCIQSKQKITKPIKDNNYFRCKWLPPYNVVKIFSDLYYELKTHQSSLYKKSDGYIVTLVNQYDSINLFFDTNYYMTKFLFWNIAGLQEPGLMYESWCFDYNDIDCAEINRVLNINRYNGYCEPQGENNERASTKNNFDQILKFLNKLPVQSSELLKKDKVIIEFWYVACPPCLESYKYIEEEIAVNRDISFIPINIYDTDSVNVSLYLDKIQINTNSIFAKTSNIDSPIIIQGCPTFILLNQKKESVIILNGFSSKNRELIQEFIDNNVNL